MAPSPITEFIHSVCALIEITRFVAAPAIAAPEHTAWVTPRKLDAHAAVQTPATTP
jgi:hypothetical protein